MLLILERNNIKCFWFYKGTTLYASDLKKGTTYVSGFKKGTTLYASGFKKGTTYASGFKKGTTLYASGFVLNGG